MLCCFNKIVKEPKKEEIQKEAEEVFEIREQIPNWDYVTRMNYLKKAWVKTNN